ncbi:hypothetical protein V8G54_006574, partial [Vigna mungo]
PHKLLNVLVLCKQGISLIVIFQKHKLTSKAINKCIHTQIQPENIYRPLSSSNQINYTPHYIQTVLIKTFELHKLRRKDIKFPEITRYTIQTIGYLPVHIHFIRKLIRI